MLKDKYISQKQLYNIINSSFEIIIIRQIVLCNFI